MELKRVRRYKEPAYPTHDILLDHPELLRLVPKRWRGNRIVLATLAATASLILSSVSRATEPQMIAGGVPHVAPLFIHGKGAGAFGCVVVSPPVFFSEDEARRIIADEAASAGLNFRPDTLTLPGVDVPLTYEKQMQWRPDGYSVGHVYPGSERRDLTLDGYDPARGIGYVFVSTNDFRAWRAKDYYSGSTVGYIDLQDTADRLRNNLACENSGPVVAVFYDPGASWRWTRDRQTRPKEVNETELREQVCDFIMWLKAQGII